jgi:hypothetical protein
MDSERPKFLIDENLAGIAKWLRFLGFDTRLAQKGISDPALARLAALENRVLVTRDNEFAESLKPDEVILVSSNDYNEQLNQVLKQIGHVSVSDWFSLCSVCNGELTLMSPQEIQNEPAIPKYIRESPNPEVCVAWKCSNCHKIYWRGSHFERTYQKLLELTDTEI